MSAVLGINTGGSREAAGKGDDVALNCAAISRLARNEVVAWFQGRLECGPRALGHRGLFALGRAERRR